MFLPLFLLLLPAAESNEAEKLFRDMEKKIASATTLACDFECKIEGGPDLEKSYKGSLALAEGNKFHMEVSSKGNDQPFKRVVTSDGTKVQRIDDGKVKAKEATPKQLGDVIRGTITRVGVLGWAIPNYPIVNEFNINDLFMVSDFKLGKKEKIGEREAQEIQYALTLKGEIVSLPVSVWLDTKTNLPLKRVLSFTKDTDKVTLTETCPKLTLDPKIDAKKFELSRD
jgi:outer membrane lipoprotein-sorting protein